MTLFLIDSLSSSSSSSNMVTPRDADGVTFGGDILDRLEDCDACADDELRRIVFSGFLGDSVALQSAS
jgi:hypothetical protein